MPTTAAPISFTPSPVRTGYATSWAESSVGFRAKGATVEDDQYLRNAAQRLMLLHPRAQAQLTFTSVWNKWVSNAPWKVYISAIGGCSPYVFKLVGAPSGMTVSERLPANATYAQRAAHGRITWPTPVAGNHTFTVRVTDQECNVVQQTVTLNIDDSNAIWVDPAGTDSTLAAGTKAAPFQKIDNWYGGVAGMGAGDRADATYANKIVIFRAGTYLLPVDDGGSNLNFGANKPCTLCAHGEEVVVLQCTNASIRAATANGAGALNRMELIGLTTFGQDVTDLNTQQVSIALDDNLWSDAFEAAVSHVICCDHIVDSWTDNGTSGTDNASAIELSATDPGSGRFRRRIQQRNLRWRNCGGDTAGDNSAGSVMMGVEHTEINNCQVESEAASVNSYVKIKHHARNICVRYCDLIVDFASSGRAPLWLLGAGGTSFPGAIIECEYNNVYQATTQNSLRVTNNQGSEGDFGTFWIRRNTFFGLRPYLAAFNTSLGTTALVRGGNVIEASPASWEEDASWAGRITQESLDVLATSGLVDAAGLLEGANRTTYLGRKGWEFA